MAPLSKKRVQECLPFEVTGVDYVGPILLCIKRGRRFKSYKGYICLSVCSSRKAIHLEFVTGLTTVTFIAAFKRFISRREHCSKLLSDNGTTFHGVNKKLCQMFRSASQFYIDSAELPRKSRVGFQRIVASRG